MLKCLKDPRLSRAVGTSQQALPAFMLPMVVYWRDFVGEEIRGGGLLSSLFLPKIHMASEPTCVGSRAQTGCGRFIVISVFKPAGKSLPAVGLASLPLCLCHYWAQLFTGL